MAPLTHPGAVDKTTVTKNKLSLNGLAGAAALAAASQAYGTVIFKPAPADIVGHDPASTTSSAPQFRNIDLDGNGTSDLRLAYRSYTFTNSFGDHYQVQQDFVTAITGTTAGYHYQTQWYAYKLNIGDFIPGRFAFGQDSSYLTRVCTYVNGYNYYPSFWRMGERGFIGFNFRDVNNQLDYGFVEIELDPFVDAAHPGGLRFFSLEYEDSGQGIMAGQVPEPSTLAALAFGGAGLAATAFRRRNKSSRR